MKANVTNMFVFSVNKSSRWLLFWKVEAVFSH